MIHRRNRAGVRRNIKQLVKRVSTRRGVRWWWPADEKTFFSEEKNQKTFPCAVATLSGGTNT
jgi:hypothetical protein